MSNPSWPAALPQTPLIEGFSEQLGDGTIQTNTDTGPPKFRRRFTAVPKMFALKLRLTSAQVDTLEAFWQNTLACGSLKFDWVNPRDQSAATFSFMKNGSSSAPTIAANDAGVYTASFSLIQWP